MRITYPLLRAVDKPWKMYPVGVLFGLGQCAVHAFHFAFARLRR